MPDKVTSYSVEGFPTGFASLVLLLSELTIIVLAAL